MDSPNAPTQFLASTQNQIIAAHAKMVRAISCVTAILVISLALGCFVLSFEALWHFAEQSGAIAAGRAWVFPLVVDGSIIVFSVSALRCSIMGESERWPLSLVVIATSFSVVFNVAHAPGGLLTALVSAMPPLLLFLSFESMMRQLRSNLRTSGVLVEQTVAPDAPEPFGGSRGKTAAATTTIPSKVAPQKTAKEGTERQAEALRLLQSGASKRAVSRQLAMGLPTIRRLALSLQSGHAEA